MFNACSAGTETSGTTTGTTTAAAAQAFPAGPSKRSRFRVFANAVAKTFKKSSLSSAKACVAACMPCSGAVKYMSLRKARSFWSSDTKMSGSSALGNHRLSNKVVKNALLSLVLSVTWGKNIGGTTPHSRMRTCENSVSGEMIFTAAPLRGLPLPPQTPRRPDAPR